MKILVKLENQNLKKTVPIGQDPERCSEGGFRRHRNPSKALVKKVRSQKQNDHKDKAQGAPGV